MTDEDDSVYMSFRVSSTAISTTCSCGALFHDKLGASTAKPLLVWFIFPHRFANHFSSCWYVSSYKSASFLPAKNIRPVSFEPSITCTSIPLIDNDIRV